jgi:serine/threonine-protein kinase
MGEVYLVNHPRLPRREALKILPRALTSDVEFSRRFTREAELAATMWHPHIVAVHDRGEADGQLWITMDYVEGTDASVLLRNHFPAGVPAPFAAEIVADVADALDYAHERGLLHRDVKPSNILLSSTDPAARGRRILLTDFGIARRMEDFGELTATNMTVGTILYSAPEQLLGQQLDGRADQYALAATAFHLLTGKPPFEGSNPAVVISSHLSGGPPSMAAGHRPELRQLDAVVSKAMAKDPNDRYRSCRDFAQALGEIGAGIQPASPAMSVRGPAAPNQDSGKATTPTAKVPPVAQATLVDVPAAPNKDSKETATPAAAVAPPGRRRRGTVAAIVIGAAALVAGGVILIPRLIGPSDGAKKGPNGTPTTQAPTSPTVAAPSTGAAAPAAVPSSAASSLLVPAEQVGDIVKQPVRTESTVGAPHDSSNLVNRPQCVGTVFIGETRVYDATGYTAFVRSVLAPSDPTTTGLHVEQLAAVMPSPDTAAKLFANTKQQWQACVGQQLTVGSPPSQSQPLLQDVQTYGDIIVQFRDVTGDVPDGYQCQHTMGVESNVIAEAIVCGADGIINDQAGEIVLGIQENASR